ncbi:uncharacterized protein LOC105008186 isoform X2 [Esox lucius]|uniref:uncharacterized protein LOC105008186 isoform X2 n=1 Tax=Esox lucius TaxID=8010 RepID=UPI001476DCEF|nr:uncharacterized protein LOC105008186 isoform X2 [Esox lucius]
MIPTSHSVNLNEPGLWSKSSWITSGQSCHQGHSRTCLKLDGTCSSSNISVALEDNKLNWTYNFPSSAVFLPTCPDCLLNQITTTINGNNFMSLELYSKRRELSAAELFQFKTQVACLNLPQAVFLNSKTEHCPDTTARIPIMEEKYMEFIQSMETEPLKGFFSVTDYLIEKAECLGWI